MLTKSLVAAATALAAGTAISLPADAAPNSQVPGAALFDTAETDGKLMRNDFMAHGRPQAQRGDGPRGRGYAEEGRHHGPRQGQPDGHRGDGPRSEQFAQGGRHGPRHGQPEARRGDGPCGEKFAEGRGYGPRQDQLQGRGHGPRQDQLQGRGRGDGPRGRMMGGPGIIANGPNQGGLSQFEYAQAPWPAGRLIVLE